MGAPDGQRREPAEIVQPAVAVRRHRPRDPLGVDDVECVRCGSRAAVPVGERADR